MRFFMEIEIEISVETSASLPFFFFFRQVDSNQRLDREEESLFLEDSERFFHYNGFQTARFGLFGF